MQKDAQIDLNGLKVDGGMVKNDLLMQIQADILGKDVIRPMMTETTASRCAAYAAGLYVGYWDSIGDLRKNWKQDRSWQPNHE